MLSTASAKMPDTRHRIYSRGDSCSSMSSNTTNTTASGSLLSASTNSSASVSDNTMSSNRKRVAIEYDGQVENRKRFDSGNSSMLENNSMIYKEAKDAPDTGDYTSLSSKDQSTSVSSKDTGDSNTAVRPRRRSHRPRGCRGGRKNRKKNQLKQQEGPSSPIPNEIGGVEKPPISNTSPLKSPTGPIAHSAVPLALPKANSPPRRPTHTFVPTETSRGYTMQTQSYALNANMNSSALTNTNVPPLPVFHSRAKIPVLSKAENSSSYTTDSDPPPFELTYSLSGDSASSSNTDNNCYPKIPTGMPYTSDEILPPPPPPTSNSRGQPLKVSGPNPYALTSTGQTPAMRLSSGYPETSNLRPSTKEFYPASTVAQRRHQHHGTTARVPTAKTTQNINQGPSCALEAIYYHKGASQYLIQQRATIGNNTHAMQGSCSGEAAAAMGSSSTPFGDSLFAISPRSFLTGAKSNPASFAW